MIEYKKLFLGMFFIISILFFVLPVSAYVESFYSSSYNNVMGSGVFSGGRSLQVDESMCQQGTDFLIQISPLSCTPTVVRSDLLEEENVNVFCKLTGIQINPFIDVSNIDYIRFSDREYPREVLSIGYQPAQAALGSISNSLGILNNNLEDNLEGTLLQNNLGYVVIVLKRQPNESALTNCEKRPLGGDICWVEGNLTANLRYDVQNSFGIGNARFYLPEMDDERWEDEYVQYNFWDGRGYIRANAVDENSAVISIYSDNTVLRGTLTGERRYTLAKYRSNINLKVGETSDKIFLPGFSPCLAGLQLTLESVEDPDTRAVLKINEDYIELGENEQFLNSRCTVLEVEKRGLTSEVKIRCREQKTNTFYLRIFPEINLTIENSQGKSSDSYGVGDYLYQSSDGQKSIYLGYIGSQGGDEGNPENLYAFLVALPEKKDSLSEEEISSVLNHAESMMNSPDAGSKFFSSVSSTTDQLSNLVLAGGKWIIRGESYRFIPYKDKDGRVLDRKFQDSIVSVNGFSIGNYLDILEDDEDYFSNYHNAMDDFETVINSYSNEVENSNDIQTFGERALKEEIELAKSVGEIRTMLELCKKFAQDYPNSFESLEDCTDYLKLSNSEVSTKDVNINEIISRISFEEVKEPSIQDYSARLVVQGPKGVMKSYDLRKNKQIILDGFREESEFSRLEGIEYVMLESLETDTARVKISVGHLATNSNDKDSFTLDTRNLEKGNSEKYGDYTFTITNINLNKVAKVSVKSNTELAKSNSTFSFKIGIEKRAIQLSPEKAADKIKSVNKSIAEWQKASDALNGVVKTMKLACTVTGAALTLKNLIANKDGKAIARQKVMGEEGGWNEKCQEEVNSKEYKSLNECFLDNSVLIENEVDDYAKIISIQNNVIRDLNSKFPDQKDFTEQYSANIVSSLDSLSSTDKTNLKVDEIKSIISSENVQKSGSVSLDQLKEMQMYALYLKENPGDEAAVQRLNSVFGDVKINSERYLQTERWATTNRLDPAKVTWIQTNKDVKEYAYEQYKKEDIAALNSISVIPTGTPVQPVQIGNERYFFVLEKSSDGVHYTIDSIYNEEGTLADSTTSDKLKNQYVFVRYTGASYHNRYSSSYGDSEPMLRYFEDTSYKCRPAIVPLDTKDGWYAAMTSSLTSYDESGRINNFYLCNVGENGIEEFQREDFGGDNCRLFYVDAREKNYDVFSGLKEEETQKLYGIAVTSINRAQDACMQGLSGKNYVNINGERIRIGAPPVINYGEKCTDFMSVKDCTLLFNLCDPVVCPSSRCDLGGNYPVSNVIQSGIVGSIALCYPNAKWEGGDVYIPVCLSGVAAGIDNWISVKKSYVDCLQTSIDTGETVGICDEINSIYTCEFFWKQSIPIIKLMIPKILEKVTGQSSQGGGEYRGIPTALENAKQTIDYFKQYYAEDSYRAFKVRSTDEVGSEICGSFISAIYPDQGSFLDNLITPDSPAQFTGKFEEIQLTTATNPPTSQYSVSYHIYAGKDSGVHYTVFLRGSESSYFRDTAQNRMVGRGYIPKGGYTSNKTDFTAPSGYQKLCIVVNGQEECGFKEVSTSFAVNYLSDLYLKQQSTETDITTEKECISGTTSLYSLLDLNMQSAAENLIDPTIYAQGIIRICSTDDPGVGTDVNVGTESARWKKVGYCGTKALGCWIDTDSVKDAIKALNLEREALGEIGNDAVDYLSENYLTINEFEEKKKEVQGTSDSLLRITLINSILDLDQVFFNYQKAYLIFWRGKSYADLATQGYQESISCTGAQEKCIGTIYFRCENEIWANKGQVNGKCGYTGSGGTVPGPKPDSEFNAKYLSPYFLFNDKNLFTSGDVCYRYYNSKWQWAVTCNGIWHEVSTFDEDVASGKANNEEKLVKDIIYALEDEEGDYIGGLAVLINKIMEDNNAELSDETFKTTNMDEEAFFTVKFKDVDYEPMKTVYYKFESNTWSWQLDDKFEGGGVWQSVSNIAPGFSDVQKSIVTSLAGKNLYEGAAILFDYTSEDIADKYFEEGGSTPVTTSLQSSLQKRDLAKVTKLMNDLSSSVYASSFKCYCGANCEDYAEWIFEGASTNNIPDELLLLAIMIQESSCRAIQSADGGDIGLMQINVLHCGTKGLSSVSADCISTLLNDNEKNIKVGSQVLKEAYSSSSKIYTCTMPVETYSGWEYALRGYNGWNTNCSKGDINYVKHVEDKYFELVRLYNGGTPSTSSSSSSSSTSSSSSSSSSSTPSSNPTTNTPISGDELTEYLEGFSDKEKEVITNAVLCDDCGIGITNICDDEECKAIGVKLGKECVYISSAFGFGNCKAKVCNVGETKCEGNLYYVCSEQGTVWIAHSADGECDEAITPPVTPTTCTDTCTSLRYECGTQTICGKSVNCGTCRTGYTCNSLGKCIGNSATTTLSDLRKKILTSAQTLNGAIVEDGCNDHCGAAANCIYSGASAGLSNCIYSAKAGKTYNIILSSGATVSTVMGTQKNDLGQIIWVTANNCVDNSDTLSYSNLLKKLSPGDRIDVVYDENDPHSLVFINWVPGQEYIMANLSDWSGRPLLRAGEFDKKGVACTPENFRAGTSRCYTYTYTVYNLSADRHPVYRLWNPVSI